MTTRINALILDDNRIIADNILKRIFKANESNLPFTNLDLVPHFLALDLSNLDTSAKSLGDEITLKEIDILLLDRGFYTLIDPTVDSAYAALDPASLYSRTDDTGIKIEKILAHVPKERFKQIKAVIVYTYDDETYVEAAQIKEWIREVLPDTFDKSSIDVVLTYPEIYDLAKSKLYRMKSVPNLPELESIGSKSDFVLYGLFMGEILYHRVIALVTRQRARRLQAKRNQTIRNLFLLFAIFTCLNLGASSLYSLLSKGKNADLILMLVSLAFALILPVLILRLKPEWIISIED
jgi:hypothetical protein